MSRSDATKVLMICGSAFSELEEQPASSSCCLSDPVLLRDLLRVPHSYRQVCARACVDAMYKSCRPRGSVRSVPSLPFIRAISLLFQPKATGRTPGRTFSRLRRETTHPANLAPPEGPCTARRRRPRPVNCDLRRTQSSCRSLRPGGRRRAELITNYLAPPEGDAMHVEGHPQPPQLRLEQPPSLLGPVEHRDVLICARQEI